jgi:hypothetical protein
MKNNKLITFAYILTLIWTIGTVYIAITDCSFFDTL